MDRSLMPVERSERISHCVSPVELVSFFKQETRGSVMGDESSVKGGNFIFDTYPRSVFAARAFAIHENHAQFSCARHRHQRSIRFVSHGNLLKLVGFN